jgi:hypothetical protein
MLVRRSARPSSPPVFSFSSLLLTFLISVPRMSARPPSSLWLRLAIPSARWLPIYLFRFLFVSLPYKSNVIEKISAFEKVGFDLLQRQSN